ncbi:MAG: membrane protein insertion efficiency factor YidD [Legionellales bacterium]|nr:membrane protein insertion efficiency factor YidD [Legionellales bacterium]
MLVKLVTILVRFYQLVISCALPPCCRFFPSCSEYAKVALKDRGFLVGVVLIVWRLLRCNPLFKGGVDLVPVSKKGNKK